MCVCVCVCACACAGMVLRYSVIKYVCIFHARACVCLWVCRVCRQCERGRHVCDGVCVCCDFLWATVRLCVCVGMRAWASGWVGVPVSL